MANFIDVSADFKEVQKALEETAKTEKAINIKALRIVAKGSVTAIKQSIRSCGVGKYTGELLKCYGYKKSKRNANTFVIYPEALNGEETIFPKVMALSYGSDKRPNRKLKAFGFVQAGQRAAENKDWSAQMQEMIDKELQKYWG